MIQASLVPNLNVLFAITVTYFWPHPHPNPPPSRGRAGLGWIIHWNRIYETHYLGKISAYSKITKPLQATLSTPELRVGNVSQTVCNEVKGKNRKEYGQSGEH
jgi:hypothetical protein